MVTICRSLRELDSFYTPFPQLTLGALCCRSHTRAFLLFTSQLHDFSPIRTVTFTVNRNDIVSVFGIDQLSELLRDSIFFIFVQRLKPDRQ